MFVRKMCKSVRQRDDSVVLANCCSLQNKSEHSYKTPIAIQCLQFCSMCLSGAHILKKTVRQRKAKEFLTRFNSEISESVFVKYPRKYLI